MSSKDTDPYANKPTPEESNTMQTIRATGIDIADKTRSHLGVIGMGLDALEGSAPPEALDFIKMMRESLTSVNQVIANAQRPIRVVRRNTAVGIAIDTAASANPGPLRPS